MRCDINTLRNSLFTILLCCLFSSCDNVSNPEPLDESNKIPDTKIEMTIYDDGNVVDYKEITKTKSTDFVPNGYGLPGNYDKGDKYIRYNINNVYTDESFFSLSFGFPFDSLAAGEVGTTGKYGDMGSYEKEEFLNYKYYQSSGRMEINSVQELVLKGRKVSYISGKIEVEYFKSNEIEKTISATIVFSGLRATKKVF